MNKFTTKASVLAALLTASVMATTSAKADELMSLENAVSMMVTQQSKAVFNQVTQQIANSIEQEVGNFSLDSFFATATGVPTVTISEMSNHSQFNEEDDSSADLPK
jgi:outer membrane receptor protein involved in Fe transport